jgi:hypothetical protein
MSSSVIRVLIRIFESLCNTLAVIAVIALIVLAIAVLFRAMNFIEDQSYAAKRRITQIIQVISICHLILLLRGLPFFLTLFSLFVQTLFYSLLDNYPGFEPTSKLFLGGIGAAVVNHFLFLWQTMKSGGIGMVETIIYFIIFVWTTPFCFLLSLGVNDETFATKKRRRETFVGRLIRRIYPDMKVVQKMN